MEALSTNYPFRHRLAFILGSSQPIADSIAKNPELGMILGDPDELGRPVTTDSTINEGRALVERSSSFLHGLDRLRHLKQRTMVRIVWNDIGSVWEPEAVWLALSALADGVLDLAARAVWAELSQEPLPVSVIALGKHGSSEVNYSSDLDLLFVASDDADQALCEKFCNRFARALDGKMGRGALYRVDLRLRPMGSSGPVYLGKSATIRYYESYCDPWEIQALIRARACAGNPEVGAGLMRDLDRLVYKGPRSDLFLDGIVSAKRRYEAQVRSRNESASNIKLGPGGIRDIEFIVQMLQLTLGDANPSLKGASVATAIEVLSDLGFLSPRATELLGSSYGFFRQVEHRIQLRQDRQLHVLPEGAAERNILAKLTGFSSWSGLNAELRRRRFLVRELLEEYVPALERATDESASLSAWLSMEQGSPEAAAADRLLASSDSPEALLAEIRQDARTADRVRTIVDRAPCVVSDLAFHRGLWDVAFGEEVEFVAADENDPGPGIRDQLERADDWEEALPTILRREAVVANLKDAHHRDIGRTFRYLTSVAETALLESLDRVGGADIDVIGLGRLGSRELLLASDWDVVLLCKGADDHERSQRIGQEWLRAARRVAIASGHFPLDVRLRPEGGSGLVVRSLHGFKAYSESSMETWERLAYTRARSLRGVSATKAAISDAIAVREWAWEDEQEVLRIRRRVQNERMRSWEATRDLKLGPGHMLDIEWIVAILRLRHPTTIDTVMRTDEMLRRYGEVGALSRKDAKHLSEAVLSFARMRNVMHLLDFDSTSVLPENPEKLKRIAQWLDLSSGNDLLAMVAVHREAVAKIFSEVIQEA
jgi:glutamate-ammonia-ligase adenylyltransferase